MVLDATKWQIMLDKKIRYGSVNDIELSSVDIEIGAEVSLESFVHTVTR